MRPIASDIAGFDIMKLVPDHEVRVASSTNLQSARSDHVTAGACLAASLGYATLRYNVFKHVPWADWPTYIVNKAMGFASLLLIAWAVVRWVRETGSGKTLMLWSGILATVHVVLSLMLLNPNYYPKFFADAKLTFVAGLSMVVGGAALALQEIGARKGHVWQSAVRRRALSLLAALVGLHAALPGLAGWFAPTIWPGGMPPITLMSAIVALLAATAGTSSTKAKSKAQKD